MLALPSLTMPSSSAQDSWCASWKYRSAKSTEWLQHLAEHAVEARVVEAARTQDQVARQVERVRRRAHRAAPGAAAAPKARCASAGKLSRTLACAAVSSSATAQPRPRGTRCRIRAPVIHDHAVAVGLASARVEAGLRRRDNIAEILDRPCAQQRLPVRPPGGAGEGRGHGEQLAPRRRSGAGRARGSARRSTPRGRAGRPACR